jgi:acetyl esterase/lipase
LDILLENAKKDKGYTPNDSASGPTATRPLEDWINLKVPPGLTGNALSLDLSTFPGFTKEFVRAEWRLGDPVELWIMKPVGVKNPPVILYLYSFPTNNDRYAHNEFGQFLTQNGFAAVGFVSALTGPRYVARPQKEWFISNLQESLAVTVHDVQFVLNYLSQRGDMDMTRVGMFGDGSGASIALMAAAVDPRIKVLDLLDPWGDWPEWLAKSALVPEDERPAYVKPDFLRTVENLDPVKWFPELKDRRVRLQLIEGLKVTPKVVQDRIEAAAPRNVELVHYNSNQDFLLKVSATGKGFDWLKEQLSSLPAPSNQVGAKNPAP